MTLKDRLESYDIDSLNRFARTNNIYVYGLSKKKLIKLLLLDCDKYKNIVYCRNNKKKKKKSGNK